MMFSSYHKRLKQLSWLIVVIAVSSASLATTVAASAQTISKTGSTVSDTTNCPTDTFLDVSKYPGAGAAYPKPELTVTCSGDMMDVKGNGIPQYKFVQITPTPLVAQTVEFQVPLNPQLAQQTTPAPIAGPLGVAVNGMPIWAASEAPVSPTEAGGDPVAQAMMDQCMGHTANVYHYHALIVKCLSDGVQNGKPSPILGYALDGFPIYGPYGCLDAACTQVVQLKSSWDRVSDPSKNVWKSYQYSRKNGAEYLDQCNGRVGPDGKYAYYATFTFPYTLGCYAGTPNRPMRPGQQGQQGQQAPQGGQGTQGQLGQGGQPNGSNVNAFSAGNQAGPNGANNVNVQGGPGNDQFGPGMMPPAGGDQGFGGPGGFGGPNFGPSAPNGGFGGPNGGPNGRHHPDLAAAAQKLDISEEQLRDALGAPPPNLEDAAQKLGITVGQLRDALGISANGGQFDGQQGPQDQQGQGGQGFQGQPGATNQQFGNAGGPPNGCTLTDQGESVCK